MSIFGCWFARCAVALPAVALSAGIAAADNLALEPKSQTEWKEAVNHGTVRILTKGLGCTCTTIASDMANVLNEPGTLRILPVIGHGSLQGIADVLYLHGIDLSILQADVLSYVQRKGIHSNIANRVRYVTKLYSSELHLIAGRHIQTIQDLDGKVVSYDVKGRGSFITAENVFNSLGIDVIPVHFERDIAIEKVRDGDIAAAFVVTGKPADSMRKVRPGNGLHFLPVPLTSDLSETYLPSQLTDQDYPQLIESGIAIQTIAVPEVLAVYNWPQDSERYAKAKAVVEKFFNNFEKFMEPVRHPKWQDVDLRTDLPGWQRFQPAQDWLDNHAASTDELSYELKVGDKVIRVTKDRIEGIDDVLSSSEQRTKDFEVKALQKDDGIHEIATGPLSIDVTPGVSGEDDASLNFMIRLSRPAQDRFPIVYTTIEGTAQEDVDFSRQSGVMIIEPGVTTAELNVELINDELKEGDENFSLILNVDPAVAELEQVEYRATISDDD